MTRKSWQGQAISIWFGKLITAYKKWGSKEAVDEMTSEMKAGGYEVISGPRVTGDGYYESCIIDFEGNQIEITV